MGQKYANAASAILAVAINAADTSITIDAAREYLFPTANTGTSAVSNATDWFKIAIQDVNGNIEICYVRSRSSGAATMSNVIRAREGTTARSFAVGSIVGVRATAVDFDEAKSASGTAFNPVGNLSSTNVQAALAELDSEKQPAGSYLTAAAVGVSVQAHDAATAKTNQAQQFSARQRTTPLTDNDLSFDLAAANDFVCTPTAGGTLTFTNITAGCKGEIVLVNNSNYTIAKAAAVKCPSSMLTTISATGRYRLAYSSLDGTNVDVTASAALS